MSGESLNAVVAFIQPFQLESVVNALRHMPRFPGMSVSEVRGFGRHGAHPPQEGELSEVVPLEKKVRLEVYCLARDATAILQAIQQAAYTGNQGDGKIFVVDVALAMRIRSGEIGLAALEGGVGNVNRGESEPVDER
jgi:nitrogen regulatory protein PII